VLQLSRFDRSDNHREAWYELVFNNADKDLLRAFTDMWQDIEDAPLTRPVKPRDFATG
jgi:hypothetical protein